MVEVINDTTQHFRIGVVLVLDDIQEEFKQGLDVIGELLAEYAIAM